MRWGGSRDRFSIFCQTLKVSWELQSHWQLVHTTFERSCRNLSEIHVFFSGWVELVLGVYLLRCKIMQSDFPLRGWWQTLVNAVLDELIQNMCEEPVESKGSKSGRIQVIRRGWSDASLNTIGWEEIKQLIFRLKLDWIMNNHCSSNRTCNKITWLQYLRHKIASFSSSPCLNHPWPLALTSYRSIQVLLMEEIMHFFGMYKDRK